MSAHVGTQAQRLYGCSVPARAVAPGAWWIFLPIGLGTFMSAASESVLATVLPVIERALNADLATIQWVLTLYLLVVSGLLLACGRLGDLHGLKSLYLAGIVLFVGGSVLCGLAPAALPLIGLHGLQAVGAAALLAGGPALLTRTFPACRRGQVLGLHVAMTHIGLAAGPALGGWVAMSWGWRTIFFLPLPLGALAFAAALRFVPSASPTRLGQRFDRWGALLFAGGLASILLCLNQGRAWGWGTTPVFALFAIGVLLLVGFGRIERRTAQPMVNLGLFRHRGFAAATASALMNYVCVYSLVFLLPFYLIQGRGMSPALAGLLISAQPTVMAITAPLSGLLADKIGVRLPATLGLALLAAGLLQLATLGSDASVGGVLIGLALAGLGTGLFVAPNNSAIMGGAPGEEQGVAAAVAATARNVGMALGVGIAGAVFTTVLAANPPRGASGDMVQAAEAAFAVAAGIGVVGALISGLTRHMGLTWVAADPALEAEAA